MNGTGTPLASLTNDVNNGHSLATLAEISSDKIKEDQTKKQDHAVLKNNAKNELINGSLIHDTNTTRQILDSNKNDLEGPVKLLNSDICRKQRVSI